MDVQHTPRWLKSQPLGIVFAKGTAAENIDQENGILRNVVMAQVGEAKGHGFHLEQEFISDLIAYDNKHHKQSGVKARFGHPSLSDTTMGSQMGIFRNFSVDGERAVADLHLLEAAELSPSNPGMRSWMLKMAEERPDFVMSSIVFKPGAYYQRDDKSKKRYCYCYEEYQDEEGYKRQRWVGPRKEFGKVFVEFGKKGEHFYTDLVEAGAATDSLFSQQFNRDKFAVRAVEFVQENADLHDFLKEHPEKLIEFAQKLGVHLPTPKVTFSEKLKGFRALFFEDTIEDDLAKVTQEFEAEKAKLLAQIEANEKQIAENLAQHNLAVQQYEDRIQQQETELETLRKRVPETHTDVQPAAENGNRDTVEYSDATLKAIKLQERRKKQKAG